MSTLRAELAPQDRHELERDEQPRTTAALEQLINGVTGATIMCGPITYRRGLGRLFHHGGFMVKPGVDVVVLVDGKPQEILRTGTFNRYSWPAQRRIDFYAVATSQRNHELTLTSPQHEMSVTVAVIYKVIHAQALLESSNPLLDLFEIVQDHLRLRLFTPNLPHAEEARVRISYALDALSILPAISALGFKIEQCRMLSWAANPGPSQSVRALLMQQIEALQAQQLGAELSDDKEHGHYIAHIWFADRDNRDDRIDIFCSCPPEYPYKPPTVFVTQRGEDQTEYKPDLLKHWTSSNTLQQLAEAVMKDFEPQ